MASNFGISELRTRFDDWISSRKRVGFEIPNKDITNKNSYLIVENSNEVESNVDLSVLLENLVIPKLIADRGNHSGRLGPRALAETIGTVRTCPLSPEDVARFAELSIDSEAGTLLDFVDNCMATGSSVDDIYVDLLAPTARKLGEFWEEDQRDFIDVTMGLWRIQEVLRELTMRVPPPAVPCQGQRSALFSSMPGEQHSFGTLMISDCFQRAGWDSETLIEPGRSELIGKFVDRHFDLFGLTISRDCPTGEITGLITAIRSVSINPGIRIMLGGHIINARSELVDECGADGTAATATRAVAMADRLVPLKAGLRAPLA